MSGPGDATLRLGLDVGDSHTDAVAMAGDALLATAKVPTTDDIASGVSAALETVLGRIAVPRQRIGAVMMGTTQFSNALLYRRGLEKVAVVRIGTPMPSLPPFADWPRDLAERVDGGHYRVDGGTEFDGRPLMPLDERACREVARKIADTGVRAIAVTAVFAPLAPDVEARVEAILADANPGAVISLSHRFSRLGFLPRENVTILNAALTGLARKAATAFRQVLDRNGMSGARVFFSQNNGSVFRVEVVEDLPVFSVRSGPTNAMRGAQYLTGLDDAVVVDVGGATTDIGVLATGFPRETQRAVMLGGVRTQVRMPEIRSVPIGGGTVVSLDRQALETHSVRADLRSRALVFGGKDVTITDLAVAGGLIDLGDSRRVRVVGAGFATRILDHVHSRIAEPIGRATARRRLPLVAVGGGAFLSPRDLPGVADVYSVENGAVANAIGACTGFVVGEVDRIFTGQRRQSAIDAASEEAAAKAIQAGADPDRLDQVEVEEIPMTYLPGNSLRVRVKVVGAVALPRIDTGRLAGEAS